MCAKELVSIVIPTLNEEENIGRLLESIIMQDYRPIEVIIVDGGSTDDTLKVINHFIEGFSGESLAIRVLSEYGECRSPANAKNIGFLSAKGKLCLFIDADYVLLEHSFISKVIDALRKSPWVSVRLIPVQGKNNLLSLAQVIQNRIWAPEGYVDERRCFRRELLEKYANPPFNPCLGVGEDADLISRLRRLGFNPIFVDAKLGDVVPHDLRRFAKRFEWYGRTSLRFYIRIHGLSLPEAVIASLRNNIGVWITLVYPLLAVLLYLALGISGLLIVLLLYVASRIRLFVKMPMKSIKVLATISFLDLIRSVAYLYGLLRGFVVAKVSRD